MSRMKFKDIDPESLSPLKRKVFEKALSKQMVDYHQIEEFTGLNKQACWRFFKKNDSDLSKNDYIILNKFNILPDDQKKPKKEDHNEKISNNHSVNLDRVLKQIETLTELIEYHKNEAEHYKKKYEKLKAVFYQRRRATDIIDSEQHLRKRKT